MSIVTTDAQESQQAEEVRYPEREDYRLLIEREWADFHHSRSQEWTALGVITGAHLGILQFLLFFRDLPTPIPFSILAILGPVLGIVFAVIGILLTCRHERLKKIKISWIYRAEDRLGLVEGQNSPGGIIPENPGLAKTPEWKGLMQPRVLSTSWLILCLYLFLIVLDVLIVVLFAFS